MTLNSDFILETKNLTKSFGGLTAVNNVTISLERGSLKSLIGPNGSGKTTFFNLITGSIPSTSGRIIFNGENITHCSMDQITRKGISRSYQITNIFPMLTTFENIRLSIQAQKNEKIPFYKSLKRAGDYEDIHDEVLQFSKLTDLDPTKLYIPASLLPHAEKRKLELSIAIASKPKLLLLDEPTAGMSIEEIPQIYDAIINIKNSYGSDLTILILEHKMDMVMKISEEVIVFSNGSILAQGKPDDIQNNEEVLTAYLGGLDNEYA